MNAIHETLTLQRPHAVVVGAGFGGIAAALRLRARGFRVTVLEANEQLGGRAATWRQDGFTFDAGPTVITAPHLFEELFRLHGRDPADYYELMPVDPFYQVRFADGTRFDYVGDEERILEQIAEFDSRDVDGYRRMADHARRIFEVGYEQLVDQPFANLSDMMRIVPDMLRLGSHRSVAGLVSKYIRDERLRRVFTFQPLLIGGNPFRCSSIYLLIHWLERCWGVHYPKGGMSALVSALGRLMDDVGIEVRFNCPVDHLEIRHGRVMGVGLEDGRRVAAEVVVANADPSTAYTRWIEPKQRQTNTDRAVARKRQSMSLFVAYMGTDRTYPDIPHHTILMGDRYKDLLEDVFERKILADDFSLYLHAPTRSDASLAPNGCESMYVLSPVPNMAGRGADIDWERVHERYRDRIFEYLEGHGLEGLRSSIVTRKSVDPRYFAGRLRSMDGAAFGPEPTLRQSAYFRYHNRSSDVRDLYFVGAGTHPGAGLPGVLNSAKVLERVVVEDVAVNMRQLVAS
jgi:phytoene desaturase